MIYIFISIYIYISYIYIYHIYIYSYIYIYIYNTHILRHFVDICIHRYFCVYSIYTERKKSADPWVLNFRNGFQESWLVSPNVVPSHPKRSMDLEVS